MLSALAGAGLLLAVVGLYGAISHIVHAQRSEIALRIAVGRPGGRVIGMVVREVMLVAVMGTITGTLWLPWVRTGSRPFSTGSSRMTPSRTAVWLCS